MHPSRILPVGLLIALGSIGCESEPAATRTPTVSPLPSAEKPTAQAQTFRIETAGSKVRFTMDAPIEKISGEIVDGTEGELHVDLTDLTKTTGSIKVDLDKLVLTQQKRKNENSELGERIKNEKQNQHARAWLEIDDKAPAADRERNRWVELKIDRVRSASVRNLTTMPGAERKVNATTVGELQLHGRKTPKRAQLEVTFAFDGDKVQSIAIKTVVPLIIGLDEHDVRPREFFGKLAQSTLEEMGQKVAREAPIEVELVAKPK